MFDLNNEEPEEIFLTLETYDEKFTQILFDFADFKSFSTFGRLLELSNISEKAPSMVLFINYKIGKRFQEGVYYKINVEILLKMDNRFVSNEGSSIIGYIVDIKGESLERLLNKTGKPPEFEYPASLPFDKYPNIINFQKGANALTKLIVRNVHQGSWNELLSNDQPKFVFDIGTSYVEKSSFVRTLIEERDNDYQNAQPNLVLSHWDVDHYHMLLEAEDATIKSFSSFVYRERLPNQTSKRVLARFQSLNPNAICAIPPFSASPKRSSDKLLPLGGSINGLQVYNGSENKSRNKGGLTISFSNKNLVVVFGADFDYSQLNNFILPKCNNKVSNYLIVPHHGGNAGSLVYDINDSFSRDAIISVGKNSYGHPLFEVKEFLKLKKFQIANLQCGTHHYVLDLT